MATAEQIKQKDQKWANKSWKPFLGMAIGGTVALIAGIVLMVIGPILSIGNNDPQTVATLIAVPMVFGIILTTIGGLLLDGGIALMIVTIIKRNRARERLGLPKDN